jgi:hypothetical protein
VPAPAPPLWARTRHCRSIKDWDSHIGMLEQDFEDMELLGVVDPLHNGPTRDEALADALGVRRTPRKSIEQGSRGRGLVETRSRNRVEPSAVHQRSLIDGSFMDADVSHVETPQLLNLRPLSNLHPSVAIECLYEEPSQTSPATNIFLASNLEGSGNLVLALVVPSGEQGDNANSLRLLSFKPSLEDPMAQLDKQKLIGSLSETLRHTIHVTELSTQACVAAEPIQTTPIPPCFLPHPRNRKNNCAQLTTEILVLKVLNGETRLCLHREGTYILDCALNNESSCQNKPAITGLNYAVCGNVDLLKSNGTSIRGSISMQIGSQALAEKALVAIETLMFTKGVGETTDEPMDFALKFRADCCRLEQALDRDTSGVSCLLEDKGWAAVETLFLSCVHFELFGETTSAHLSSPGSSIDPKRPAWGRLLESSFHSSFSADNIDTMFLGRRSDVFSRARNRSYTTKHDQCLSILSSIGSLSNSCLASGISVMSDFFDTLHLVYEDLKLSCSSNRPCQLRSVGTVLALSCHAARLSHGKHLRLEEASKLALFLKHYARDLGDDYVKTLQEDYKDNIISVDKGSILMITSFDEPPCILSRLDTIVKQNLEKSFYSNDVSKINPALRSTRSLLRIFSLLFASEINSLLERDYLVVSALCEEGFPDALAIREQLPAGIALPLLEVLIRCREDPELATRSGWTSSEFTLVGREDLTRNNSSDVPVISRKNSSKTEPVRVSDVDNPTYADKDKDGLVPLEVSSSALFPKDNRVREAGRLLRSSRPCFLSVPRAIEVSDHEYERLKQSKLLLLCRRALALPIGRGMLTIGSFQPVAAEPLPVPDLCLVGRIPPTNASLALDMSECQSEFRMWPEFHNGVAAGLRLPLQGEIDESVSKITRSWIVYNRPTASRSDTQTQNQTNGQTPLQNNHSHAHGGLLLALGLRGHLAELEMTDIYDYLTQGQVTLTCGVLLGMAANKRGSCDISVSKMLCLHLPSLIPQHFSAIDVASPVQTCAVAGAGLLFQGSSHRMMTEFLLNEIGRRPESDIALDREAYTLACGIALGMVNICKGERISDASKVGGGGEGLADLRIGERLYRYIVGGTDDEEGHRMREANDRLNLPASCASGENERCSCVFEGDSINIDVTAAGATLALGLIFMKTG